MKLHTVTGNLENMSYVYEQLDILMPEIVSTTLIGIPIAFVGDIESVSIVIELLYTSQCFLMLQ